MYFSKHPGFIILNTIEDDSIFEVAINGFLLTHHTQNYMLFCNSLMHLKVWIEENPVLQKLFSNKDDYSIKGVHDHKFIHSLSEEDINNIETDRCYVLFSALTRKILDNGYKRVILEELAN